MFMNRNITDILVYIGICLLNGFEIFFPKKKDAERDPMPIVVDKIDVGPRRGSNPLEKMQKLSFFMP